MTFSGPTSSYKARLGAVLIAVLIMLVALGRNTRTERDHVLIAELPNPDSYYNLVAVRDASREHGLHWIARDNAPDGSWVHWTLPYSWVLLQSDRLLQHSGLDDDKALLYGGAALTALSMIMVTLFIALAVACMSTRSATMVSGLVLANSVPLHGYGRIDQVTHHVFMLVPLAAAAAALLWLPRRGKAALDLSAGLLLGLALWISPETMPFVVGLAGIRMAQRLSLPMAPAVWPVAAGVVAMVMLAWHFDPPPPGFSLWALDRMSLAYVLLAGLLAAVLLVCDLCTQRRLPLRHGLLIVLIASMVAAVIWMRVVPGVIGGPTTLVPAELKPLWWDHINELQAASSSAEWIAWLTMPLAAAIVAGWVAWREKSLWLAALALMALAYGCLGVWHTRMGAAAGVAASLVFCIALGRLPAFADGAPPALSRRTQIGAFLLTILAPLQLGAFVGLNLLFPDPETGTDKQCSLQSVSAVLQELPPATILTGVFSGPELLYRTHHRVIAGPYHHNIGGILDNYHAWLDTGDAPRARTIVEQRDIDYVLGCKHFQGELKGKAGQRTLAQRAADGDVPAWLQALPWPAGTQSDWHLYRVIHDVKTSAGAGRDPALSLRSNAPPSGNDPPHAP